MSLLTLLHPAGAGGPASAVSILDEWTSEADATSYTSPNTRTPAANSYLVAFVHVSGTASPPPAGAFTGYGLTWVARRNMFINGGADWLGNYTIAAGASPGTGTAAMATSATDAGTGISVVIMEITNASSSVQSSDDLGASGAPATTLAQAPVSGNAVVGWAVAANTNPAAYGPPH